MPGGTITSAEYEELPPIGVGDFILSLPNRGTHNFTVDNFTQPPFDVNEPNPTPADNVLYAVKITAFTGAPLGSLELNNVLQNVFPFEVLASELDADQFVYIGPDMDETDTDILTFEISNAGAPIEFIPSGGATITIITAEKEDVYTPVMGVGGGSDGGEACANSGGSGILYIPFGETFETTALIWLLPDLTGVPPPQYYSNGEVSRQWNGVDTLGPVEACVPPPIELAYDLTDSGSIICEEVKGSFYVPIGEVFADATALYTDYTLEPQFIADPGFYSDGLITREWTGTGFEVAQSTCPRIGVLLRNGPNQFDPCTVGTQITLYIEAGAIWETAETLSFNPDGSGVPAIDEWYSDGDITRHWTGTEFAPFENANCF